MPAQFDTYEFRFYANNGFSRLATSTNVVVSTEPPAVSISLTNPFPGTTYNAPSNLVVDAVASVTNGTIARVEFFAGAALIGTATSAPYSVVWNAPPAGSHLLTAVAIDNTNRATTSPDVSIAIGTAGTGAGTLGPPIASPPAGAYAQALAVTLSAAAGATIRYTTDGSHPADYGVVYSGPIAIAAPTTVLAIALQGGWVASAMLGATYQIDAVPPAISTRVLPPSNAAGWNNTDVTVTFVCTDNVAVGDCPAPVVVSQEGTAVVAGTATDTAGNQATASMTVMIDRTVPAAMLTNLTDGLVTAATSVVVGGQVADALAGVTSVTCNGVATTFANGNVQCDVPLQPGRNAVVVHAADAAGNSMSAGVNVTRVGTASTVKVTPSEGTLLVGFSQQFSLADDYGVGLTAIEWTSSDANIASVDLLGVTTAVATGTATITGNKDGLSAQATVTVVGGASLPSGTVRWSVAPAAGFSIRSPIYSHRVSDEVPEIFSVEADSATDRIFTVRGVGPTGDQRWTTVAPGEPIFGDAFGGLVSSLMNSGGERIGFARSSGPSGTLPWRYQSPGLVSLAAQGPDGTIFAREDMVNRRPNGSIILDAFVLALDGNTGRVKLRLPVPREISNEDECVPNSALETRPLMSGPVVGTDGSGYFVMRSARFTRLCSGERSVYRELRLLRIHPSGTTSFHTVFQYNYTGPTLACTFPNPTPEEMLPDSLSGVLVTWRRRLDAGCNGIEKLVSRVADDGTVSQFALPSFEWSVKATGEDVAYIGRSTTITGAVDITNWTPRWSIAETSGSAAMPLADGGLAVQGNGTILAVDGAGTVTQTGGLNAFRLASSVHFGFWEGVTAGKLVSLNGPELHEATFSFVVGVGTVQKVGNAQRSGAPRALHRSIDQAAVAVLQYYNLPSILNNVEYGGSICARNHQYLATIPNVSPSIDSGAVIPSLCDSPTIRVGDYHTHGQYGNDGFSGGDIARANADTIGNFFTQYFVATPCGNIDRYIGPAAAGNVPIRLAAKTTTPISCVP